MLLIFVTLLIVLFFIHVYFYERSLKEKKEDIAFALFRRIYSFKYFFPASINARLSIEQLKWRKLSNQFLYGFYILFVLIIVYAAVNKL